MTNTTFNLLITYSQLCIFLSILDETFNDWSNRSFSQDFTWRPESASFRSLVEEGEHIVHLYIDEPIPPLNNYPGQKRYHKAHYPQVIQLNSFQHFEYKVVLEFKEAPHQRHLVSQVVQRRSSFLSVLIFKFLKLSRLDEKNPF